jgi:hypothetical protein
MNMAEERRIFLTAERERGFGQSSAGNKSSGWCSVERGASEIARSARSTHVFRREVGLVKVPGVGDVRAVDCCGDVSARATFSDPPPLYSRSTTSGAFGPMSMAQAPIPPTGLAEPSL